MTTYQRDIEREMTKKYEYEHIINSEAFKQLIEELSKDLDE